MHEASARLAGGSLLAAAAILDGSAVRAVNFGGGMHHASRDRASGFCIYNDAALAIQRLLDGGVQRVAYIDVDAHHGDGTQSIFWDDPRVLTISLHETGLTLFPGTGFANEIGGPNALGSAVNVALPGRHRGRRLAAGLPRRGAAARRRLRTGSRSSASTAATPTGLIR